MKIYKDAILREKEHSYYLNVADFVIKIILGPTEHIYFKRKLIEEIQNVWGSGGFLKSHTKKVDLKIFYKKSESNFSVVSKNKGKEHYFLGYELNLEKSEIYLPYFSGIPHLNLALREAVLFLLDDNGLLFHSSCVVDEKKNIYVFMAKSGGGKSTISNMLKSDNNYIKVADDSLIFRRLKDTWYLFTTPFIEKNVLPKSLKSKKINIYLIKKGNLVEVRKIEKDLVTILLEQLWLRNNNLKGNKLKLLMSFSKENSFFELTCTLNKSDLINVLK